MKIDVRLDDGDIRGIISDYINKHYMLALRPDQITIFARAKGESDYWREARSLVAEAKIV